MKLLFLLLFVLFASPALGQTEEECRKEVDKIIESQVAPTTYEGWSRIPSTRACGILNIYREIYREKFLDVTLGTIDLGVSNKPNIKYVTVYLVYFRNSVE